MRVALALLADYANVSDQGSSISLKFLIGTSRAASLLDTMLCNSYYGLRSQSAKRGTTKSISIKLLAFRPRGAPVNRLTDGDHQ